MAALGMFALGITPATTIPVNNRNLIDADLKLKDHQKTENIGESKKDIYKRSQSSAPYLNFYMPSPKEVISRYLFGYHSKTKRTLAEEAETGDEISVCSWIRDGFDPNEKDFYGYTPLLNAAALGRVNAVRELIKNGAKIESKGPYGFTALHAAAQNGHREVVALLLKNGSDINSQNDDMDTPMHLALRANRIEIVYMLLRNGGNAKIEGFMQKDCIKIATENHMHDLAKTLKHYMPRFARHYSLQV